MGIASGACLAAVAGGITGWIATLLRPHARHRRSVFLPAVLGALLAALAYGAFLGAGIVLSFLMFSGAPEPRPAVLGVVVGCALFLAFTWLQSVLGARFGLRETRDAAGRRGVRDLLDARPSGGPSTMWLGGVGLALLPALYGIRCLTTQKGSLGTLLWPSAVEGVAASALGLGWIGMGAFLHFHFFFGLHPRLEMHSRAGKRVALAAAFTGFSIAGVWSVVAKVPR